MYQIFTKVFAKPLEYEGILIDYFTRCAKDDKDMSVFKSAFECEADFEFWILNSGTFKTREAAVHFLDKHAAEGEYYFILEKYKK